MNASFSIVHHPAAALKRKAKKIVTVTEEHRTIFKDMIRAMRKANGIGLAAPQVGLDLQMAVVDAGEGLITMVNPVILKKEGWDSMEEGCLSVPQNLVKVKRAKKIILKYLDEWGKLNTKNFQGLTAKAIQHEVDHLNGRLIVDYMPWYKKVFSR